MWVWTIALWGVFGLSLAGAGERVRDARTRLELSEFTSLYQRLYQAPVVSESLTTESLRAESFRVRAELAELGLGPDDFLLTKAVQFIDPYDLEKSVKRAQAAGLNELDLEQIYAPRAVFQNWYKTDRQFIVFAESLKRGTPVESLHFPMIQKVQAALSPRAETIRLNPSTKIYWMQWLFSEDFLVRVPLETWFATPLQDVRPILMEGYRVGRSRWGQENTPLPNQDILNLLNNETLARQYLGGDARLSKAGIKSLIFFDPMYCKSEYPEKYRDLQYRRPDSEIGRDEGSGALSWYDLIEDNLDTLRMPMETVNAEGRSCFLLSYAPPGKKLGFLMDRYFARVQFAIRALQEGRPGWDAVEEAIAAQKAFVFLHPFTDRNGRIARLIQNLILNGADIISPIPEKMNQDLTLDAAQWSREEIRASIVRHIGYLDFCIQQMRAGSERVSTFCPLI